MLHKPDAVSKINPCHVELIKLPHPLLIFSQSEYLIQIVDINSHSEWQTVQIQISWLLQKPTDLDLHCWQMQDVSGLIRTRVKIKKTATCNCFLYLSLYFDTTNTTLVFSQVIA